LEGAHIKLLAGNRTETAYAAAAGFTAALQPHKSGARRRDREIKGKGGFGRYKGTEVVEIFEHTKSPHSGRLVDTHLS